MRFDLANAPSPAKIAPVSPSNAIVASSPKLLDRVRWLLRAKHYSIRTEQAYVDWTRRFILFHNKRHPGEMGEDEISAFLNDLAINRKVSASTQNQALSALLFLYQASLTVNFRFLTLSNASNARPKSRLSSPGSKLTKFSLNSMVIIA